ncbi:hypothetical protein ABZT27_36460 [Streptomyces sp. NPDC005389]|uniref:hypothetical protein n=1 Tax=Streptomyces sp. NPDC005389 TaxID=3157040 RepID=UPI0033AA3B4E
MGMAIADRLAKKRTLLEWLRYQTAVTEREIRALEHEAEEDARRRDVARREQAWVVSAPRTPEGHPVLHRGNCALRATYGAGELLDITSVMGAVEEYPGLEMCDMCAPWGSLGLGRPRGTPERPAGVEFP